MIIFLNILFLISLFIFIYLFAEIINNAKLNEKISKHVQIKNEKYYKDLVNYYNKNQKVKLAYKLNLIYKINILIDKAGIKRGILINPITIIIYSIVSFVISFLVVYKLFGIIMLSLIISLPSLLLPKFVLEFIRDANSKKLEDTMLDFLLQLKNYTKINNDIIYAFKQVKTLEPLQSYIDTFLLQVNSGIKFEKAIENIKDKMNFDTIKSVFSNIEYCYIYGGDFSQLMDKSYKMILRIQKEKHSRAQETKSARLVLGILILLDLFVYFNFIKSNYENYIIMTRRVLGNLILYWNFISMWILLLLMKKVKELEY